MRSMLLNGVLIFSLAILATGSLRAQVHVIYTGEPAMLVTDGLKHGSIQWQSSAHQVVWTDEPGWNHDSITFMPTTALKWYRAKITSGTCNPVYSSIQGIKMFQCGDTIVDYRDGQKYHTVPIGSQCWMGRNMNVGVMTYGHLAMQNDSIIEKYCFANDTNNCNTYGALYQWDEMMQYSSTEGAQGICPKGFHVPSDQDILDLEIYLGMNPTIAGLMNLWRGTDEGTKLKQGGSSGFNANLTGLRYDGGLFYNQGTFEYIYTSTTNSTNTALALRRCLSDADPTIGRYNNTTKTVGGSVRCLKDN